VKIIHKQEEICNKCKHISKHEDYDLICDWCGKYIEEKGDNFEIGLYGVKNNSNYEHIKRNFCSILCSMVWVKNHLENWMNSFEGEEPIRYPFTHLFYIRRNNVDEFLQYVTIPEKKLKLLPKNAKMGVEYKEQVIEKSKRKRNGKN